jgi:5-methylcytosine-specific restriction enzyme B
MTEKPGSEFRSADFEWIPFYRELAQALVPYRAKQAELIQFLTDLHTGGLIGISLEDKDANGSRFPLVEIDGFTFFANFNRGISPDKRTAIVRRVKERFRIQADVPRDFSGVPLVNNQSSWFFSYADKREPQDVDVLWDVFERALLPNALSDPSFGQVFDRALQVRNTSINPTMGLFWIRPDEFLNLDSINRSFLGLKLPAAGLSFAFYKETIEKIREHHPDFPRLSHAAWLANHQREKSSRTKDKVSRPKVDAETSEHRVWLFQANPKIYDIEAALHELPEIA